MITEFPEYIVTKTAYRAIKGKWNSDFDNIHWSHTLEGSKSSYKSIYGSHKGISIYRAKIKGFDVHSFWRDISKIEFFKKILTFTYMDEEEIMVDSILDEVVLIKEDSLKYD